MSDQGQQEYDQTFVDVLELVWGEGYLSPGGAGEVAAVIGDVSLRGKSVLDIGCGSGGIGRLLVEEYGAQAPVELLRQFLDMKGFYDRDKLFWKDVENTMLIACAAPPGGGRARRVGFGQRLKTVKLEIPSDEPPLWDADTKLKVVGYGTGTLFGQKLKGTEVITTYSPLPLPWELLPPALQAVIGTGPEGLAEVTIITEY